jgi:hypothetical protein
MGGRDYFRLALAPRPNRCNLKTMSQLTRFTTDDLNWALVFAGPNTQHMLPPVFDAHVRACALLLPQNSQSTQAMPLGDYFMYCVASNGLRPFRPKFRKLYINSRTVTRGGTGTNTPLNSRVSGQTFTFTPFPWNEET